MCVTFSAFWLSHCIEQRGYHTKHCSLDDAWCKQAALHHTRFTVDFESLQFFVCLTSIKNEMKYVKNIIWSLRENLSLGVCEQHRRRPAQLISAFVIRVLESILYILTCYKRNFNFLASLCSWGDWFEYRFVGNPGDRFSRDEALGSLGI